MTTRTNAPPSHAAEAVRDDADARGGEKRRGLDAEHVWAYLDGLAKPRRSLGKLEELAVRLAIIQGTLKVAVKPRRLVIFAGDHGVVARGVSAWPSEVTGLMVGTMLMGRAASSALAAAHDCSVRLVDVGVSSPPPESPPPFFRNARVANGTRDLSTDSAMTAAQFDAAWQAGADEATRAINEGNTVLIAGEMGIGNTTAAACLTSLLTGIAPEQATGHGAGVDEVSFNLKREVVGAAIARALSESEEKGESGLRSAAATSDAREARRRHAVANASIDSKAVTDASPDGKPVAAATNPSEAGSYCAAAHSEKNAAPGTSAIRRASIEAVSGFEIVAMAGFFAAGARLGATLLLDGYVATSAALIAEHLHPGTARAMIAAHLSAEPGHAAALDHLKLVPLLNWNMRLGEGTGALTALPFLDSAAALLTNVAQLSDLGVPRED